MRIIFLGTPDFSVFSLESILKSRHEVVAVVTQPDKPVGRNAVLTPSPVKAFASQQNLKVLQYDKISKQGVDDLKALKPDIMVTCAFGQILSQEVLDIAPHGVINVHASLLPKFRGASPIQSAVLSGETETGVTIMQTERGLDCGDIIMVEKTEILPEETSSELFDRLAPIGAKLVVEALDKIEDGTAEFVKQNESQATFVKQIKKSDAEINWEKDCKTLKNFVRGMLSWPCAFTYLNGKILKIFKVEAEFYNNESQHYPCGQVVCADKSNGLKVACKDGLIKIYQLQLEGGKRMSASDFVLGRKVSIGDYLKKC